MSTSKKQSTNTADEAPTTPEVETAVESTAQTLAPSPSASAVALRPAFDASTFEGQIAAVGEKLQAIAEGAPELKEKIEELALYMTAKVLGDENSRGIRAPDINIRQMMTKEESLPGDVKVGHLYTKQANLGQEIEFVPLHSHFKRTRFVKGSTRPECFSDDGVIGSKWGECAKCPHSKFVEGERSGCSSGRQVTVVASDFSQLYQIGFSKTSSKTGKKLMDLAASPRGIFSGAFKLTTKKESGKEGDYYVYTVAPTGKKLVGSEYATAYALSEFYEIKFKMGVERRNAGGDPRGMINGNAGGGLPSGGGGDAEPNFADEGL